MATIKERMAALQAASGETGASPGKPMSAKERKTSVQAGTEQPAGETLFAAWTKKPGTVTGMWHKRWLVLYSDPAIRFFEDEELTKVKGGCSLAGASISQADDCFQSLSGVAGVLKFKAASKAEAEMWAARLKAAVKGEAYVAPPTPEPAPMAPPRSPSFKPAKKPAAKPADVVLDPSSPSMQQLVGVAARLQKVAGDDAKPPPAIAAGASQEQLAVQLEGAIAVIERAWVQLGLKQAEGLACRLVRRAGLEPPGAGRVWSGHLTPAPSSRRSAWRPAPPLEARPRRASTWRRSSPSSRRW